jgi:predicted small secreted protein
MRRQFGRLLGPQFNQTSLTLNQSCRILHTIKATLKGTVMKFLAIIITTLALTACGTLGGAVSGAGQDLSKAGEWIRNR